MDNKVKSQRKMKTQIKNTLTLPKTVLHILLEGKQPPHPDIKEALHCIDEIVDLINEL